MVGEAILYHEKYFRARRNKNKKNYSSTKNEMTFNFNLITISSALEKKMFPKLTKYLKPHTKGLDTKMSVLHNSKSEKFQIKENKQLANQSRYHSSAKPAQST